MTRKSPEAHGRHTIRDVAARAQVSASTVSRVLRAVKDLDYVADARARAVAGAGTASRIARALQSAGSRLVLCGRPPLGAGTPATVIEYDNEGGAHAMTSHLRSMGHRRILFLGRAGSTTALGRERGYRRVREAMAGGRRFTAVFAATDMVAAGALTALHESGVDVPGEVSLAGYDDIPFARDLHPALTTVHVPYEEMGRTAVRTVLDRRADAGDEHRMLGTHVVLRASVRAAAPGVGV